MKRFVRIAGGIVLLLLVLVAGYFFGRSAQPPPAGTPIPSAAAPAEAQQEQIYTCSMHPQIRLPDPGNCPICEMPLVPLTAAQGKGGDVPQLNFSEHALAMLGVETTPVTARDLSHDLRAVGKVQYNESSLATVTARVDGYVEKLFANITGVTIKAGDHLAEIYSPALLVAQQELLLAQQGGQDRPLLETAKLKLQRWGLTEKQISDLVAAKKITDRVTLYSPISGTILEKMAVENSAFKAGDALYRIANLDTVWVYLDIYELDLPWVRYGQQVELTAEAFPGQVFTGMVTFVEPVLSEQTRTVRVPVHVENANHALKPGMFVSAVVKARLGPDGLAAPTGVEGKYTCTMHPQILKEEPGACPLCAMRLEQIPGAAHQHAHGDSAQPSAVQYACPMRCEGDKTYPEPGRCPVCNMALEKLEPEPGQKEGGGGALLAVPASAVLDSGTRRLVFVEMEHGTFSPREVILGPRSGEFFPVLQGLSEGERVVTRGGFLIDSQFQITGHPSLYYPGGLQAASGHQHPSEVEPSGSPPAVQSPAPVPTDNHNHQ